MISRAVRFFQIDIDYLWVKLPFFSKFFSVVLTDIHVFLNLFLRRSSGVISFPQQKIAYDTPYATKTFLAAVYDFYIETKRLSIFPDRPVIVDIGANIGQYLFAIKSFLPDAAVYSFEPDPVIFGLLEKNASFYQHVTLFPFGLSDKAGRVPFFRSDEFSEWSSLVQPEKGKPFQKISIETKKGDTVLKSLSSIDLLKIDVEGAELPVIQGLLKTLRKSRYLLIETSLARDVHHTHTNQLLRLLLDEGFQLEHIGRIFSDGLGKTQGAVDLLFRNGKIN